MTFDGKGPASAGRKAVTPRPIAAAPVKNARLSMFFLSLNARLQTSKRKGRAVRGGPTLLVLSPQEVCDFCHSHTCPLLET